MTSTTLPVGFRILQFANDAISSPQTSWASDHESIRSLNAHWSSWTTGSAKRWEAVIAVHVKTNANQTISETIGSST